MRIGNKYAISAVKYEYNKKPKLNIYVARYLGIDSFEIEEPNNKDSPKYEYVVNQIYDYHNVIMKNIANVPYWTYIDSYKFKLGLE
jgi:hypothetical protein